MRFRVDMPGRGLAEGSLEVVSAEFTDTTENYTLFDYVGIEDPVLLKVMRDRILREEWRLQADLGADPLPFGMRLVRGVLARPARSELRSKRSALDLIELFEVLPGFVAARAGNVDFESDDSHTNLLKPFHHGGTESRNLS